MKRLSTLLLLATTLLAIRPVAAAPEVSVLVQVTPATRQQITQTITAFGRVQADPDRRYALAPAHAGVVEHVAVRAGERIAKGAPLLTLTTAPDARRAYRQATNAVTYARQALARQRRLFKEQLSTLEQVAAAQKRLKDAEAQLAAQRQLGGDSMRHIYRAPFAGVVAQLNVAPGQRIAADTLALQLAPNDALLVPLGVEQEDAARVKQGMRVTLAPVFRPDLRLQATVGRVAAMVNPRTRLVDVIVPIPRAESSGLFIDGSMRGEIELGHMKALTVPRSAVLRDEQGAYLFIVKAGHAHRIDVTTGPLQDDAIAVSGSVREGERVVTSGNYELQDGMAVREGGQ